MNKRTINKLIKHLGIEIQHCRGDGYFYFISSDTGDQIGDNVMVCYYHQLSKEQWISAAIEACK